MCLILKKPAGRTIPADFLQHVWQHNPDGWGLCHRAGTPDAPRLAWTKGMALAELLVHNAHLPREAEAWLHLRRATVGPVSHDMAHPHLVRDTPQGGLLLLHNGTLETLRPGAAPAPCSDSAELARLLGELMHGLEEAQAARLLRSPALARLLQPLLAGSMVVLLDAQGEVCLGRDWVTLQAGHWSADMAGLAVSNLQAWQPRGLEPQATGLNGTASPWWQAWHERARQSRRGRLARAS
ncbi:hypothetical protein [Ideonella livida]|uniref:Glutamine amidotransferase type-2 domain-containing protein n=1 Tax=Ideonella livida TaxID=2707176 RepID=A0A7C9TLD4_9BURK|nr:hypothetical protein [Ideonella livida]NDY93301.1 hypothetical protein [Ideonella livida]